ncbi:hypothetical protein CKAH01_19036 [Colletotrichum kahawae]|uniref:Uncharacterized protein n=1 Tax=Colletotrichum kahawae TaxID=34407 RepID=A0AAD9Y2M8_COLKA|nr:hypothetical protein CKAH01_19036 [Colletotrichum kahawae]
MLQYYHANLVLYARFIIDYEEMYVLEKQPMFDPRLSDFKPGHLKEITKYSCRINEFERAGQRIVEGIEHLLAIAREAVACENATASERPNFADMELEIHGYCKETKGCLARLSGSLDHDMKFLGLRREMKQTSKVQQLTVLATIFLPLSLSAGVLSMQTRFKDLGALLYDFFGVTIILGVFVAPFLLFLKFLVLARDHILVNLDFEISQENKRRRPRNSYLAMRQYLSVGLWILLSVLAMLVLVSFILGMFKNVYLGAKVLGFENGSIRLCRASCNLHSLVCFIRSKAVDITEEEKMAAQGRSRRGNQDGSFGAILYWERYAKPTDCVCPE